MLFPLCLEHKLALALCLVHKTHCLPLFQRHDFCLLTYLLSLLIKKPQISLPFYKREYSKWLRVTALDSTFNPYSLKARNCWARILTSLILSVFIYKMGRQLAEDLMFGHVKWLGCFLAGSKCYVIMVLVMELIYAPNPFTLWKWLHSLNI